MTRHSTLSRDHVEPDTHTSWRSVVIRAASIVLATLIAYMPVLVDGGFIWDDDDYLTGNELLLDLHGLGRIWIPRETHQYYPLVFSTFWIEHKLWGFNPHGYHIVNVLLHIANALLLWRLFLVLKLPGAGAWMIGAVFALHPVHVESVAWITERKNVLSALCYLLAAMSYLRFDTMQFDERRPRRDTPGWYGLSLVLFVMALLSKTVTCSLPAALILAMLWQRKRLTAARLAWLAPMFVIGLVLALHTAHIERINVGAVGPDFQFSFIQRLLIACNALLSYPWKIIWPHPLIFIYRRWPIEAPTTAMWLAIPAVAAIAVACVFAFLRGRRGVPLALAYFAGTIFPALGFFNVYPMRYSFVADHFQYLASIGIIAAIVGILMPLVARWRNLQYVLAAGVLAILGVLTFREGPEYRDVRTLWNHTIQDNPRAWMALNNFGKILLVDGKPAEAIPYFQASLAEHPDHYEAIANMAIALGRLDRYDEAIPYWERALAHHRAQPIDHVGMAFALFKTGDIEGAIRHYTTALEQIPLNREARLQLGVIYAQQGRNDDAAAQFAVVVRVEPTNVTARHFLGMQAEQSSDFSGAIEHYSAGLEGATEKDHQHMLAVRLARVLATCPVESLRDYELAAALSSRVLEESGGNDPLVLNILAQALFGQGRVDEAIRALELAIPSAREAGHAQLVDELLQRLDQYRREAGD